MSDQSCLQRWSKIVGEYELTLKLAAIYGVNRATVTRWALKGFPTMAVHILEVVEKVPREKLPARLRKLIADNWYEKPTRGKAA